MFAFFMLATSMNKASFRILLSPNTSSTLMIMAIATKTLVLNLQIQVFKSLKGKERNENSKSLGKRISKSPKP